MRNKKRAQLKIQEMSFMLLALVLFFIIAGLFYVMLSTTNLRTEYLRLQREGAITLVARIADTPELSCGKSLCVDFDKALVLKKRGAYDDFWRGVESLEIRKIYPYISQDIECNAGNIDTCSILTIKEAETTDIIKDESYVVLCRKEADGDRVYDKCEIGVVIAGTKKVIE